MRFWITTSLAATLALSASAAGGWLQNGKALPEEIQRGGSGLAVATFNIHHGVGTDGVLDLGRVVDVIGGTDLDVAGLQEVDQNFGSRSGWHDEPLEIGLGAARFVAYGPVISRGGRNYGNAILSRAFIIQSDNHLFQGWPARERRGFVHALVGTWPRPVHVISTHLGLARPERASEARELVEFIRGLEGPVILFGDLNERLGGEAVGVIREVLSSATSVETPTFRLRASAWRGAADSQIDYIFLSRHFLTWRVAAVHGPASDHSALVADVVMDPGLVVEDLRRAEEFLTTRRR